MNLQLIKSENFGDIQCDIYGNGNDFYMTREQIGGALEYSEPRVAIAKMHKAHKARLGKYSTVTKLVTVDGKKREVTLYNRKGIMEICRHSDQPKADDFMDWVWDLMDGLISGKYQINEAPASDDTKKLLAQAKYNNARARASNEWLKIGKMLDSPTHKQICASYASQELAGKPVIALPETQKTYSATEIAAMFGVTAYLIGVTAKKHNLKTEKYGVWVMDKSRSSAKEVSTFRYYANAIPEFRKLLDGETA